MSLSSAWAMVANKKPIEGEQQFEDHAQMAGNIKSIRLKLNISEITEIKKSGKQQFEDHILHVTRTD